MKLVSVLFTLLMLIGCAYKQQYTSKSYWIKDGKQVPPRQVQRDYLECGNSYWVKDEGTIEEYKRDVDFCISASYERDRHRETIRTWLGTPGKIVGEWTSLSVERCMQSKGYKKGESREDQCMKDKGYEWIEEK